MPAAAVRRMLCRFALPLAACAALALATGPAAAQEQFAGHWRITAATVASWAKAPADPGDTADAKRLVGQAVTIGRGLFKAPAPLGCRKPSFEFRDAGADTLFEGGLNADGEDKPTDPVALARALGMTTPMVRGMTASCSEVEFFLIDPDTILFGLNNRVFRMTRDKR